MREFVLLMRLLLACAPQTSSGDEELSEGGDQGAKAAAVAKFVEGVVGTGSLVNAVDIQSGSEQAITQVAAGSSHALPTLIPCISGKGGRN